MSDTPQQNAAGSPSPRVIHPLTIWVPIIVMCLGVVVLWNYLVKRKMEESVPRLPITSRLEKNFTFTERSGQSVELKELKGKVILACWVYTRCPRGCAGVVAEMMKLHKEFGDNPDIHFLCVSVDPDDSPEQLRQFTDNFQIKGDNWWFVTAPKDALRVYMTRYFGFYDVQEIPEKDRLSPDDKFSHDMKIALVDRQAHVRGHYEVFNGDREYNDFFKEKLRKDIKTLLDDKETASR